MIAETKISWIKRFILNQKKRFSTINIVVNYDKYSKYLDIEIKFFIDDNHGVGARTTINTNKLENNLYFYQQVDNLRYLFNRLIADYYKKYKHKKGIVGMV